MFFNFSSKIIFLIKKALNRIWKGSDENGKRLLSLAEFQMAIIYHHVLINEIEGDQLFNELDVNRLGLLDYDVFLAKLMVFFNKSLF